MREKKGGRTESCFPRCQQPSIISGDMRMRGKKDGRVKFCFLRCKQPNIVSGDISCCRCVGDITDDSGIGGGGCTSMGV